MKTRKTRNPKLHYTLKKGGGVLSPKYKIDNVVEYIDGSKVTIIEQLSYKNGTWQYNAQFPDGATRLIEESNIKRLISEGNNMNVRVREREREMYAFRKQHPNVSSKPKPTTFEDHQEESKKVAAKAFAKEQQRKKEKRRTIDSVKNKFGLPKFSKKEYKKNDEIIYKNRDYKNKGQEPLILAKITLIDNTDPQKVFYSLKPNDDPEKDIQCGIERIEKVPPYENYNKNEFLFKHFYDKMKDSNFKCKDAIGLLVNMDEIMHDYLGYNGERNYEFSIEKIKFLSFICNEYYKDNSPLQKSTMPSGAEFPSIRDRNSILQSFYLDFVEFCENSGFFNNKIVQTKKILESNLEKLRNKEIPVPFFSGREQPDLSKIDNMSSKNKDTNGFKWVKTPDGWVKIEESKVDEKIEEPKVEEIEEPKVDEQSTSYMSAAQNERNVVPDNFAFRLSRHNDPPSSVPYFCPKECLEKIEKINDIVKKNDIKNQEDHKNITEDIKKLKNTVELRDDINQKEHAYIKTNVNELRDEIKEAFVKLGNVVDDQLKIKSEEINKLRKDINEALSNINKKVNHIDKKVRDLSEMVRDEKSSTSQPIYRNVGPYNIEEDENLDYEDMKRLKYLESLGYGMPSSSNEAQLWLDNFDNMGATTRDSVYMNWWNSLNAEDKNYWYSILDRLNNP
tara:strand:- start:1387 stop:3411 length:2025 start_codon:yes stop_codon:yes gene_type:complete